MGTRLSEPQAGSHVSRRQPPHCRALRPDPHFSPSGHSKKHPQKGGKALLWDRFAGEPEVALPPGAELTVALHPGSLPAMSVQNRYTIFSEFY